VHPARRHESMGDTRSKAKSVAQSHLTICSDRMPNMRKVPTGMLILVLLSLGVPALADLAAGQRAYAVGDYAGALREFLPLAQQGNATAQLNIGDLYNEGHAVPQDYQEAARWYRLAGEQGNAWAQLNLGVLYGKGQGVPQDYKEAAHWYRLAAEQGNAWAQSNLGVMYVEGQGLPRDAVEGTRWLRLGAEQGNVYAQSNLGLRYLNGQGVPQDYIQAHMWFNLAGASGNAEGIKNRDAVARKMTPAQIADAQRLAREWKAKTNK